MKLILNFYDINNEVNIMVDQETLNIFDELYYDTYQDILKYVICNCKNIYDVKDIVQNVYLESLKKIKYKKDINAAYIMGIAKHKIKDYYRFKYKIKLVSLFTSKNEESNLLLYLIHILTLPTNSLV